MSIFLIICGHYVYEYYTETKRINLYEDINKQYLKVSDDLSKEHYNRTQMKSELKEYIKTCL